MQRLEVSGALRLI